MALGFMTKYLSGFAIFTLRSRPSSYSYFIKTFVKKPKICFAVGDQTPWKQRPADRYLSTSPRRGKKEQDEKRLSRKSPMSGTCK